MPHFQLVLQELQKNDKSINSGQRCDPNLSLVSVSKRYIQDQLSSGDTYILSCRQSGPGLPLHCDPAPPPRVLASWTIVHPIAK
jgi:hypothetical protein